MGTQTMKTNWVSRVLFPGRYVIHVEDTAGLSDPERARERESNGERETQRRKRQRESRIDDSTLQSGFEDFIGAHAVYGGIS